MSHTELEAKFLAKIFALSDINVITFMMEGSGGLTGENLILNFPDLVRAKSLILFF